MNTIKKLFSTALFCGLALLTNPASAEMEVYTFEKPHTQIGFYVSHLGFSHSHGRFLDFDGSLELDRDNPSNSKVSVTIDTNSIEMNHEKWNESMRSKKFFDVENYPEMSFESSQVIPQGEDKAIVNGKLTMLGQTQPVILNVTYNKSGNNPFSGVYTAGFSAKASIKRSDWGMDYGLPGVGDDVQIHLEVEAQCQSGCPETTNE